MLQEVTEKLNIASTTMKHFLLLQGFMIDGFPVDLDQAEAFVRDIGPPAKVILFRANNNVLKGRLLSRC